MIWLKTRDKIKVIDQGKESKMRAYLQRMSKQPKNPKGHLYFTMFDYLLMVAMQIYAATPHYQQKKILFVF